MLAIPERYDTLYLAIALPFGNYPFSGLGLDSGGYSLMAYQELNCEPAARSDEPRGFYGGDSLAILQVNSHLSGINLVLESSVTPGFTGTISYGGSQTGMHISDGVLHARLGWHSSRRRHASEHTGNGDYTAVTDSFTTYYAQAFMDVNNNLQWDADEPYGIYGDDAAAPITVDSANIPGGIDITMMDTDAAPAPASLLPSSFTITAYPNPFNATTRIRFTVPVAGPVELTVFDLLGREIAVLQRGILTAGTHESTFNGAALSSGLYILRLQVGSHTACTKIALLK